MGRPRHLRHPMGDHSGTSRIHLEPFGGHFGTSWAPFWGECLVRLKLPTAATTESHTTPCAKHWPRHLCITRGCAAFTRTPRQTSPAVQRIGHLLVFLLHPHTHARRHTQAHTRSHTIHSRAEKNVRTKKRNNNLHTQMHSRTRARTDRYARTHTDTRR